jgi:hypothetical protein
MIPLGGFFQLGYVTNDIEKAIDLYAKQFGAPEWTTFDSGSMNPDNPYPSMIGLAWVGSVQVELIQPKATPAPLYAEAMPKSGFGINIHHLGYILEDEAEWNAANAAVKSQELRVATHLKIDGVIELIYADARPLLGHYLEYVWLQPKGRKFLIDDVPRNRSRGV